MLLEAVVTVFVLTQLAYCVGNGALVSLLVRRPDAWSMTGPSSESPPRGPRPNVIGRRYDPMEGRTVRSVPRRRT